MADVDMEMESHIEEYQEIKKGLSDELDEEAKKINK